MGPPGLLLGGFIGGAAGGGAFLNNSPNWNSIVTILDNMSPAERLAFGKAVAKIALKKFGLSELAQLIAADNQVKHQLLKEAGTACHVNLS